MKALTAKKYCCRYSKHHDISIGLHKKVMENYIVMMMETTSKSVTFEENTPITLSKTES